MKNVLLIAEFILAILLIIVIMLQPSKQDGLKGFIGGGTQDTFFSKNKSRTRESLLSKLTVIIAVLIAFIAIALQYYK